MRFNNIMPEEVIVNVFILYFIATVIVISIYLLKIQ
jgi:hypothetical protein